MLIFAKKNLHIFLILIFIPVFYSPDSRAGCKDVHFQQALNTGAYNNSLIQDKDGFLWIGCSKGIIRYDGYGTITFKAGPGGLSSNYAPTIFEDDDGLLWIGTVGGGLNVYDKKSNRFIWYKNIPGNASSL
ncbi:MAG: hypothetical protein KKH99_05290, partial [Proteobacteria bacterium]|nr:hypothetical protein [Pseudomonadota bacterium]